MDTKLEDLFVIIKKIIVAHKFKYHLQQKYHYAEGRNAYGFVYLLSGELDYAFKDGRRLNVQAGDCILLKPTDAYTITCMAECEHYTVNFMIDERSIEGELLRSVLSSKTTPKTPRQTAQNAYAECLNELCMAWAQKKEGYQMHCISLLYKLFYRFLRAQRPYVSDKNHEKVKRAKEYIDTHWQENFTLQELANLCFLSTAHFRHLFEQVFKISPIEYRNSLRLLHAKDYLLQNHFTITEIAYQCGFDDVNYFSRFFKKHTGISPSKYTLG